MEVLCRMILVLVQHGFMAEFLVGDSNRNTLNISHLLVADNTLIFCEAKNNQSRGIGVLLLCFEAVSGLRVTFDKSKLVQLVLFISPIPD